MSALRVIRDPAPASLGAGVDELLGALGGPACFVLRGEDPRRTRALVTLLHGNEPSGVIGLHRWLREGRRPAVNVVCVVASVAAALEPPAFSHRMLPGVRDLNRCFRPPYEDPPGLLARDITDALRAHAPEALVDVHNTSGSGPSFGVCTHIDRQHDALVSLFTRRLIVSNLGLGTLMEAGEGVAPAVTIEVGGRLDDEAHELAYEGICRYFHEEDVLDPGDSDWGIELLHSPIRLELRDHVTLAYGERPDPRADITLKSDIERHNFGVVSPDTHLGWIRGEARAHFRALDAEGRCAVSRIVRDDGGALYPARPLKLFMITNDAAIARSDCLLYAVADDGSALSGRAASGQR